jgi:pimeloyl-ACP methyl ester carboxylesterase
VTIKIKLLDLKSLLARRWVRVGLVLTLILGASGVLAARLFPLQIRDWREARRARELGLVAIRSSNGLAGQSLGAAGQGVRSSCLVLVHGAGDSASTWHRLIAQFQEKTKSAFYPERLQIVAWELPGHGKSERTPDTDEGMARLRPQRMAQALFQATQELGCTEKSIWMGNSLGGWVAAWVGVENPEHVRGLILLGPAGLEAQAAKSLGLDEPTVESLKEFRKRAYAQVGEELPDWVWRAAVERVRASSLKRVRAAVKPEDYLDSRLGSVKVPVIVIWGKQDRVLPLSDGLGWKSLAPESMSSFREIDQCGHLPQKECPEAPLTAVRDILQFGMF